MARGPTGQLSDDEMVALESPRFHPNCDKHLGFPSPPPELEKASRSVARRCEGDPRVWSGTQLIRERGRHD